MFLSVKGWISYFKLLYIGKVDIYIEHKVG